MSLRIRKYRLHRGSGQALVQIDGERINLGKYDTPESKEKYRRVIAEWMASHQSSPKQPPNGHVEAGISINEVLLAYWKFAESYYVHDGEPTKELDCMREAIWPIRHLFGSTKAEDFGPKALKTVRQFMLDEQDLCRKLINHRIRRIRRVFKWAVAEELVPPSVFHGLQAVEGLRFGRTEARESEPV